MIRALLVSMRPAQWLKNVFVLAAPVFGKRLTAQADILLVGKTFGLFCLTSSGVYLLNDVLAIAGIPNIACAQSPDITRVPFYKVRE